MRIFNVYRGVKGFVTLYHDALRYAYMITPKALRKAHILVFWEKHGLRATLDAFPVKRATLFLWKKQFIAGGKKAEALNEKKRTPLTKRKRLWPEPIIAEIKRQRSLHPNIGKDKVHIIIAPFCEQNNLPLPSVSTIGRIIKDCGGLRVFPQRVRHNGKIVPIKRKRVIRKPYDFKAEYPGHLVALDTIERFVHGLRRYIITFEDIHTRFSFAWATTSHASLAAKEFFDYCRMVFPYPFVFVLTDNGSEFMKHFDEELRRLHLIHYHTYPRTPKMNAHCERFNRTIQEEFVDYHAGALIDPVAFNQQLIPWLVWYNTERPHWGLNLQSPMQFILTAQSEKSNMRWTDTCA
ncbi:MAG: integrase core domain-containing protein [Candidatus Sungiibacteriota bacterium]